MGLGALLDGILHGILRLRGWAMSKRLQRRARMRAMTQRRRIFRKDLLCKCYYWAWLGPSGSAV